VSLAEGTEKGWEQTTWVATLSPAPDQQGTAESVGLPSLSQIPAAISRQFWAICMTLCGSKQIWKGVIKLTGEVCKSRCKLRNDPSSVFFWGLLFPSQCQTSLLSLLILCSGQMSTWADRWPSVASPSGNFFDLYFHLLAQLLSCPRSGVWLHLSA